MTKAANLHRNEVNWLLHDRETANKAIGELKPAGFADCELLVAIQNQAERESFAVETQAQALAAGQFPATQVRAKSFSCSKQKRAPRTL